MRGRKCRCRRENQYHRSIGLGEHPIQRAGRSISLSCTQETSVAQVQHLRCPSDGYLRLASRRRSVEEFEGRSTKIKCRAVPGHLPEMDAARRRDAPGVVADVGGYAIGILLGTDNEALMVE